MIATIETCAGPRIVPHYAGGYRLDIRPGSGWRLTCGTSRFLVADGPPWSIPIGRALLRDLQNRAMRRAMPRRPIRAK